MRGVWRLIPNEQVIEIEPCERGDWLSVIGQMGDEAICRGLGDVENQELFRGLLIFSVQCSSGERSEDELVHFQDKHGHEGIFGRLVGYGTDYLHWNPGLFRLHKENKMIPVFQNKFNKFCQLGINSFSANLGTSLQMTSQEISLPWNI